MAETEENPGASGTGDEIKPYKVHVSSKYLELTRQKLELTRLPHEGSGAGPASGDWWAPKPQVEPIIDYWLEKYSWRDQEAILNQTPQFRTALAVPGTTAPAKVATTTTTTTGTGTGTADNPQPADALLRLHLIHAPSSHGRAALPLLLLPPFPLSNLVLSHLVRTLSEPDDATRDRPFHLVIPALPGLGFSDPLPDGATDEIVATAGMLDALMARLGYAHYLVSNAGPAHASPGGIDWKLIECLSSRHAGSCVGAHFVAPPLASPKLVEAPVEWAKWTIASALGKGILGYSEQDFSALRQEGADGGSRKKGLTPSKLGLNNVGLREPNTLAYAMCDSPTGLLVFAMKGLSLLRPRMQLTPEQIITFTNLAWLPGPEYAMRFWARCAAADDAKPKETKKTINKPKVGITVFLGGDDDDTTGDASAAAEAGEGAIRLEAPMLLGISTGYACPAWANPHYNVLYSQRVAGKPGLLAWERPEVLLAGIRGLAREIIKVDQRLDSKPLPVPESTTAPLEQIVIADEGEVAGAGGLKPPERPVLEQGDSSRTQVASQPPSSPKGKEIEADLASPKKADEDDEEEEEEERDRSEREETPDTVVRVTAPTDDDITKK